MILDQKDRNVKRRDRYTNDSSFMNMCKGKRKDWVESNKEYYLQYLRHWNATRREYNKNAVINVLTNGEGTCRWCGQGDLDVLTVDHIDNDGAQHRKKVPLSSFYSWMIKNDYPPGFQVLCANCNLKKEVMRRRALRPDIEPLRRQPSRKVTR